MFLDYKLILPLLKADEKMLLEANGNIFNTNNIGQASFENILTQYSEIRQKNFQALIDRYAEDMEMFGYKFEKETLKASCEIRRKDGTFCC